MKILVISPKNKTVFNFRGDLIKDMIAKGNDVYVTGPNRDYEEDILALGVKKLIEIPFVKDNTSVFGDLSYLRNLKQVISTLRPDLVFSYTIKPVIYGSIAAKNAKVSHIYAMVTGLGRVYANDGLKTKIVRMVTKILYKKAFKACDKVIFQNRDDIEELVSDGYLTKEKTVQVNGSGVNMKRFSKAPLPEKPAFLMVSRVIREKGIMEYCEAAQSVKKEFPDVQCILLGGFDASIGALKREDIEPYISDGSIEYPGEVKDPVSYFEKSSVFVLPSYYREGLPRTILEAMACGRPVITTDWPGCREPIENGINGYLVSIKDSELLADKMKQIISNDVQLQQMSEAAYKTCTEKYDVNIINAQMREIMKY